MLTYLKENWVAATAGVIAILMLFAFTAAQGCSLDDMVKVPVPGPIRDATGAGAKESLRESKYTLQQWRVYVQTSTDEYVESIEHGQRVKALLVSAVDTGLAQIETPLATLPGGTIAFGLLTGLSGLFLNKPGSAKEKESAYNKGLEVGAKQVLEATKSVSAS